MRSGRIVVLHRINEFMVLPFFPRFVRFLRLRGPEEAKNLAGQKCPPPDSDPYSDIEFGENLQAWQDKSLPANLPSGSRKTATLSASRLPHRSPAAAGRRRVDSRAVWLKSYRFVNAVCRIGLLISICALTLWICAACSFTVAARIASIPSSCSTFLCSLRNSLSNIALTIS
jgi:hypothetical protein